MSDGEAAATFGWPIRVYIEDTDAGGIVFHARYLHYMERARTEWVRSCGVGLRAGLAAEPVAFGRVWMEFRQRVVRVRDQKQLCEADVKVACIALDSGRPMRLPDNMRGLLEQATLSNETKHDISQE